MILGGDITNNNGSGGMTIFGPTFYTVPQNNSNQYPAGSLVLVPIKENTFSSNFGIITQSNTELESPHLIIGQVVEGMSHVHFLTGLSQDSEGSFQDVIEITYSKIE